MESRFVVPPHPKAKNAADSKVTVVIFID